MHARARSPGLPRPPVAAAATAARLRRSPCWPAALLFAAVACIAIGRRALEEHGRAGSRGAPGGDHAGAGGRLAPLAFPAAGGQHQAPADGQPSLHTNPASAQPTHNFLIFFSGHQGSSALADMLAAHPSVFVPGFEPLDAPGLTPAQKLAFLEATFALPPAGADAAAWSRWQSALLPPVPGLRVDRQQLRQLAAGQLAGKSVAGFKMRPYPLKAQAGGDERSASSEEDSSSSEGAYDGHGLVVSTAGTAAANTTTNGTATPGGHTAMSGLDPAVVRELLRRHNVSVLLTLRRNTVKEALSWYKARELGVSQFSSIKASKAGGKDSNDSSNLGPGRAGSSGGDGGAKRATASQGGHSRRLQQNQRDSPAGGHDLAGSTTFGTAALGTAAVQEGAKKLRADIPRVLRWLTYTEWANAQLHEASAFFGRPTHTIWYEDFLAEPLSVTEQAAAFIGIPGTAAAGRGVGDGGGGDGGGGTGNSAAVSALATTEAGGLQLSSKFKKVGPDEIEDWLENYGELCAALEGTPHYRHLNAAACPAPRSSTNSISPASSSGSSSNSSAPASSTRSNSNGSAPANSTRSGGNSSPIAGSNSSSSANSSGASSSGSGSDGTAVAAMPVNKQPAQAQEQLLRSWCVPADKVASGWSGLSDAACMQRFRARQEAAVVAVRGGNGTLLFKHVHKAGGSTLCQLAMRNMAAESPPLPFRADWNTNCVPYEAFLGPHPAVGSGGARTLEHAAGAGEVGAGGGASSPPLPIAGGNGSAVEDSADAAGEQGRPSRKLQANWLGGACWLGFLTPPQLRALPHHFRPLTFVASEGPLPDAVALDAPLAWVTMLRRPLDRVLSSFHWWQLMMERMPQAPAECHAYSAPSNATLEQWLEAVPDNWMTRELMGRTALYARHRRLTEGDLHTAKQRLHLFAAVLLLEQPESSMALLRSRFGWDVAEGAWDAHRAGSRRGSDAAAQLPEAVLRRLEESNRLDLELYAYAEALHAEQAQRWLGRSL